MILLDRQKREIKPGVRVAYNLSGGVAIGVVAYTREMTKPGSKYRKFRIVIQPDLPWSQVASKKGFSTVDFHRWTDGRPAGLPDEHLVTKVVVLR